MPPQNALPAGRRRRRLARPSVVLSATVLSGLVLPLVAPSAGAATTPTAAYASTAALPYRNAALPVQQRVADLLARMTLQEKIGQMAQAERADVYDQPSLIKTRNLGSVLSGGGSTPTVNNPSAWADMVDRFQEQALATRLGIPMIYGIDAVHGHGNVQGATIFPHNVGMGATRDPALVQAEGRVTASEVRGTGIPWDFAPCLCVTRDERWGRTYESFGEDPSLVRAMETSIDGLQGTTPKAQSQAEGVRIDQSHVLATAKHFAGDGDTEYGTGNGDYAIDQGITRTSRDQFNRIDLAPFVDAVQEHHIQSVMPSYSSVQFTDEGQTTPVNMHGNKELVQGTLKNVLGFSGFVISDYLGIDHVPGDYATQVATGVNAGIDMFMEPGRTDRFIATLTDDVTKGMVSTARIDDAVTRILTVKMEIGLFEHPKANRSLTTQVGSPAHRAVAREAAAKSQVLLKNAGGALPLARSGKIYVAGRSANDIGNQSGGWTVTWQGFSGNAGQQPGTTVLQGMRQVAPGAQITYSADGSAPANGAQVGVVVVGETPYSEGYGDVGGPEWAYDPADANQPREEKRLVLQPQDRATVDRVCTALPTCVVLVVSGRTQVVSPQLSKIDALVASWLPGTEGAGVADVLFGRRPFTGQLPVTWPRTAGQEPINVGDAAYDPQYPFGWGLRTDSARQRLATEVTALRDRPQDADVKAALTYVQRADRASYWDADGSVKDAASVVLLLQRAADRLGQSPLDTAALRNAVASVVREVAQDAVVAGRARTGAAALIARADVALLQGRPGQAVELLAQAAGSLPMAAQLTPAAAAQLTAL